MIYMKFQRIKLKTGYLIYAEDDFILMDSASDTYDYAGVIEVVNSNLPHYIFVSSSPLEYLTHQEEDEVIDMLCMKIPELQGIREKEVKPIFTSKGVLKNLHEWICSPKICIFPIKEIGSEKELVNGVGILRRGDIYGI